MADNVIQEWMVEWFAQKTSQGRDEILQGMADNYFDRGWIDSIQFIELVSDVEDHFQVAFSNDDFQNREFATIQGICGTIAARRGQ